LFFFNYNIDLSITYGKKWVPILNSVIIIMENQREMISQDGMLVRTDMRINYRPEIG